jgi:hypothetical protein
MGIRSPSDQPVYLALDGPIAAGGLAPRSGTSESR